MRQPIARMSETWPCGARTTTSPLNVSKTKELIVDYRNWIGDHTPIHIDGVVVARVKSFKFLLRPHQ
jgi:hypothetical protein